MLTAKNDYQDYLNIPYLSSNTHKNKSKNTIVSDSTKLQQIAKSSVKKYQAMQNTVCDDG